MELRFTILSYGLNPRPCLQDNYLEIRDGNDRSANVLGVFCVDHKTTVVRSSGRYLWLGFFHDYSIYLIAEYSEKSFNQTGKIFLAKLITVKALG